MASNEQILADLTAILRGLLDDDDITLRPETRRDSVPNWDSFNYLNFIIAIEGKYNVKFPLSQVESFENVGAVVEALQKRITG